MALTVRSRNICANRKVPAAYSEAVWDKDPFPLFFITTAPTEVRLVHYTEAARSILIINQFGKRWI